VVPKPSADRAASPPQALVDHTSWLLAGMHRAVNRKMLEGLSKLGLRLGHTAVLATVEEGGPQAQQQVAARIGMDSGDLVAFVDELEGLGLVTRTRDEHDRRRSLLAITPAGRRRHQQIETVIAAAHDDAFAALSNADRTKLHSLLLRVYSDQAR
jgi:DNA-binding MarR family transcriptional regulator